MTLVVSLICKPIQVHLGLTVSSMSRNCTHLKGKICTVEHSFSVEFQFHCLLRTWLEHLFPLKINPGIFCVSKSTNWITMTEGAKMMLLLSFLPSKTLWARLENHYETSVYRWDGHGQDCWIIFVVFPHEQATHRASERKRVRSSQLYWVMQLQRDWFLHVCIFASYLFAVWFHA